MAGIFDSLLDTVDSDLPLLNVCHTTKDSKENHKNLIGKTIIRTSLCKVYNKMLLYTFYGRPSYKVPASHYPMCFVFSLSDGDSKQVDRKMAFDSGAFHDGRMKKYFDGSGASLEDFELGLPKFVALPKFIKHFYKTNKSYFEGEVNNLLKNDTNDTINRYVSMLNDADDATLDERRRSIEIQFEQDFDLNTKRPVLLILSTAHVKDQEEKTILESKLDCEVIFYDQHKSGDFYQDIREIVRKYLNENSLI